MLTVLLPYKRTGSQGGKDGQKTSVGEHLPREMRGGEMSMARGEFEGLLGDARPLLADERSFCTKESAPVVEITGNAVSPGRGAVMEGSHRRQSAGALLKSKQAAEYLAISVRQLQYLSERQEVAVIEMGKNCVRYDRADLDDYIDRRRRPCRKEVTHG